MNIFTDQLIFNPEELNAVVESVLQLHNEVLARTDFLTYNVHRENEEDAVSSAAYSVFCTACSDKRYATAINQIASFCVRLAQDHAFADGNKRTASMVPPAMITYYSDGECTLCISDDKLYECIEEAATRQIDELTFARILLKNIKTQ